MKKEFNNAGVAALQQEVLQLPTLEKQAKIDAVRLDFQQFMKDHFLLSIDQQNDLANLPLPLSTHLAAGIASTWEQDEKVIFDKEDEPESKGVKDIITDPPVPDPSATASTTYRSSTGTTFLIWIRYNSL